MSKLDAITGIPELTCRETEILTFVAKGLSAKEIAQEVEIAPRTVERHIENVRLKIRARNRTHMVTMAISNGILELDDLDEDHGSHST